MRRLAWSIIPVLVVGTIGLSGCKVEEGSPSDELPPPGGGMGGMVGGGMGGMVGGGMGGMVSGGAGGMVTTGGAGGMVSGGMGGTTVMGGTGGMTAGSGGMTAGSGGTDAAGSGGSMEAGTGGSAGTPAQDDVATCISDAMAMGRSGPCAECGCNKCLAQLMNCQDDACNNVVKCGQMAGCKGRACYCGAADAATCAIAGAEGPCVNEIATAAGVCDMSAPNTCAIMLADITNTAGANYDANNPVSRANAVSVCTRGQVAEAATVLTPEVVAVAGMCETECM